MTDIIVFIIALTLSVTAFYLYIRNLKVWKFQTVLNHMCSSICEDEIENISKQTDDLEEIQKSFDENMRIWNSIMSISYARMLFSIKPLKLKYWLNMEQIDFLRKYNFESNEE